MSTGIANHIPVSGSPPIIVDLGKIGGKEVKRLKRGEGVYVEEVLPAVQQVRAGLDKEGDKKEFQTVVVIYERKSKRRNLLFPPFI